MMAAIEPIPASHYDHAYFQGGGSKSNYQRYDWETFGNLMTALAHFLMQCFPDTRSVLDVGCATGLLVRAFREIEAAAWGIDHSVYCLEHADPLARPYMACASLTCPYQSLGMLGEAFVWQREGYDLVTACETLEHLTADELAVALPRLRAQTRHYLFATVPVADMWHRGAWAAAQAEPSHVSLYPRAWWYDHFRAAGFRHDRIHELAEQYCHERPLVTRMGWQVFLFGV